jgi:hypothetical protein
VKRTPQNLARTEMMVLFTLYEDVLNGGRGAKLVFDQSLLSQDR